jgi:hypothetical protein
MIVFLLDVFLVRLDDAESARRPPAGSAGQAAIFTDRVKASHLIRKVLLRQIAIVTASIRFERN